MKRLIAALIATVAVAAPAVAGAETVPDLSNNTPASLTQLRAIKAHGHSNIIIKLSEGTHFIDGDAGHMTVDAHRLGMKVGGYDFLHPCSTNPVDEANLFSARYNALKLDLRPWGDAEWPWPGVICSQAHMRAWLTSWLEQVQRQTGRWPGLYSAKGWWDPHVGCWWPRLHGKIVRRWVASYPNLILPCGVSSASLHQFGSNVFNGAFPGDMSQVLAHGALGSEPPPVPKLAVKYCRELNKFRKRSPHHAYAKQRIRFLHNYFTKKHEHGTARYHCKDAATRESL